MQNVAMFIDDYIIVFDERKPIVVAGDTYLIGSFILMKLRYFLVYQKMQEMFHLHIHYRK